MLRRNSSRSKQRRPLVRSKSANSIFTSLSAIEPSDAERDALVAAKISFHRAQARQGKSSFDMPSASKDIASCVLNRSNAIACGTDFASNSTAKPRPQSSASGCTVQKQQSIRFAGPNARPRKPLAVRANEASLPHQTARNEAKSSKSHQAFTLALADHARSSGASRTTGGSTTDEGIAIWSPQRGLEAGLYSNGRLRKSRSMVTALQTTSHFDTSDDPDDRLDTWLSASHNDTEDKENAHGRHFRIHSLRAPKSMSFLRSTGHSWSSSQVEHGVSNSVIPIHTPWRNVTRTRLRRHPSLFFRSKHRRCETSIGMPRSLRNSSDNSAGRSSAFSGSSTNVMKHSGLRFTARKVSRSLRTKFKGLFGKPRSADDAIGSGLQSPQQLASDTESCNIIVSAGEPEEASMSMVPSHVPSLHAVPSNQQLRSRQGSLESVYLEQQATSDDKSRVTSWTNSTNTAASAASHAEWERQRLSVIKENGMHVPSSTRQCARPAALTPGHQEGVGTNEQVYSALLQRLSEKWQKDGVGTGEAVETCGFVPPRSSSVEHGDSWSPPTIRHIRPDDDVFQDTPKAAGNPTGTSSAGFEKTNLTRMASYKAYPDPTAGDGLGLTPERAMQSCVEPPKSLAHSSVFSGSPTGHLFRTNTPYRRALRETMKDQQESGYTHALDTRYLSTLSALSLPSRRPSTVGSEQDLKNMYAESSYSCSTDEVDTGTSEEAVATSPPTSHSHGDAPMLTNQAVCKHALFHSRDISATSSMEWKTWLSANVSKLETPSTTMNIDAKYDTSASLPLIGHVREHAEIESPGDVPKHDGVTPAGKGDLTPLRQSDDWYKTRVSKEIRQRQSRETDENSPPGPHGRAVKGIGDSPPPVPSRSRLRTVPSLPSFGGNTASNERTTTMLPRMRSLNAMAHTTSPREEQLLRRRARARLGAGTVSPAKSSPGLTAAFKRQFGTASDDCQRHGLDNDTAQTFESPRQCLNSNGSGKDKTDWEAQKLGSKRMVDLFLSSRRKRIKGSKTSTESDVSAAYI